MATGDFQAALTAASASQNVADLYYYTMVAQALKQQGIISL